MKFTSIIILTLLLSACAHSPPVIDVSDSIYKSNSAIDISKKEISSINFRITADDGTYVKGGIGSDTLFPIRPATTTKQTVESDLRRFFSSVTSAKSSAPRSMTVTIGKADSYWTMSAAANTPILGLALVGSDTDFGMNVRILIEIEESGKVIASYIFDEKIIIQGKSTNGEAIRESYKVLVAAYRKRLFSELESRFVPRYL
jgi:hypothetical protein